MEIGRSHCNMGTYTSCVMFMNLKPCSSLSPAHVAAAFCYSGMLLTLPKLDCCVTAQVNVSRGMQSYKTLDSGYTLLTETGLYRAVYPVFDYDTKAPCESTTILPLL